MDSCGGNWRYVRRGRLSLRGPDRPGRGRTLSACLTSKLRCRNSPMTQLTFSQRIARRVLTGPDLAGSENGSEAMTWMRRSHEGMEGLT
jgi:hypothetical protein